VVGGGNIAGKEKRVTCGQAKRHGGVPEKCFKGKKVEAGIRAEVVGGLWGGRWETVFVVFCWLVFWGWVGVWGGGKSEYGGGRGGQVWRQMGQNFFRDTQIEIIVGDRAIYIQSRFGL